MNVKLDKDDFFEIITVFVVEEAKERGKELVGMDPSELTEYEQLLAHIAKFPMKTDLKLAKYKVDPMLKMQGRRLADSMLKSDHVRLITG
jgi:hypothetical protein